MKKNIILLVIIVIILGLYLFLRSDIDIYMFKYGFKDFYSVSDYKTNDPMELKLETKYIDELQLLLTDKAYYFPDLKEFQFGIIFNKSRWNSANNKRPISYFDVELEDDKGNIYQKEGFYNRTGKVHVFQCRFIEEIDLSQINSLYIKIYPLKISNTRVIRETPVKKQIYIKHKD